MPAPGAFSLFDRLLCFLHLFLLAFNQSAEVVIVLADIAETCGKEEARIHIAIAIDCVIGVGGAARDD